MGPRPSDQPWPGQDRYQIVPASKKIKVRRAEPKDIVNIAKLLKQGWNEPTVEFAPINDVCGYRWILGILEEGFAVVADLDGRIVGAALVSGYRPLWSLTWLMTVEALYILPSFRRDGIAESLITAVEGFADKHKAALTFGIQTAEKPLVKDRMMKIAGWQYVGGNFLRAARGQEREENEDRTEE